ncbi:MAG: FAD-dependent oxidoreductase [Sulfurimonas sp.]|jgi:glycine/D-amino acid oxidase-like deaminating enzyme|nr:FAD-dependent oxidoreductase [Sulfurimonadaceae bacterium]
MKIYDYIIIGSGIAGSSVAYLLNKNAKSVALIDKLPIASGGSGAAGAFLSPLPGKVNPYNTLVNDALGFSLSFYESFIPEAFVKNGLLRVKNRHFDEDKFFSQAGIVEPKKVLEKLLLGIDFYIKDIKKLEKTDDFYVFDDICAKNIILAQGVLTPLLDLPYIKIEPIFGVKLDVISSTKPPYNIHKDISISTTKKDGTISIGATKQRHDTKNFSCETSCDLCQFASDDLQIDSLLKSADEMLKLEDLQIIKIYKGSRASIKSYFPVVGKLIDYKNSLEKHPSIAHGTKIPHELLSYHEDVFILNALGSRGFVLAPYVADILTKHLLKDEPIPKHISTHKLFYKKARA